MDKTKLDKTKNKGKKALPHFYLVEFLFLA